MLDINPELTQNLVQDYLQKDVEATTILNEGLIGGMAVIGKEFKAKELWVPDVLLAADNMHSGIKILKPVLQRSQAASKGTFVIGTVIGDIHDIGKNIVVALMEGAGFTVIDLGVNVPPETFVKAVKEHRPVAVGLSALLTTTMLERARSSPLSKVTRATALRKDCWRCSRHPGICGRNRR